MKTSHIPKTTLHIQGIPTTQAITGAGPPVLMLHGWGAEIALVWPLATQLAQAGFWVHALDLPGFGETAPPPVPWSVGDYARFVLAYADHHHIEQFYLFGHSFGGRLGLMLGAEYGGRILKMVLADSAGIRPRTPFMTQVRLRVYKALRGGLNHIGLKHLSENLSQWYNRRYGSADFQNTSGVMRETFINVVNQDMSSYARRVQPPTLLLWGDQDQDTPLWQGKMLEQLIPDAGLVVYEGAGHYSYLDCLTEAARVMTYFFKSES